MGASTSWLAVKGKPQARVLEELALRVGDSPSDAQESGLQGCDFPGGWYVIAARDYGHPLTEDATLQRLSLGCEAVAGGVETHVMCSTACGWKDGKEVWWMDHDSEVSVENLSTRGQVPAVFSGIHKNLLAEQEAEGGPDCGVDFIFSAPEELTKALTGYHYEESEPDETWHPLVAAPPPKKSWLGGLFKK
ncbi:MAG TPA: hypothetical protein VH597_10150 [Verrucomicrobiae bacterium]|jgi:hypothetical protein|nr:hypothetical protein [Verrucomicrobiae bacterium]